MTVDVPQNSFRILLLAASRSRIQLTTDGLKVYINAVLDAFGEDVDYAMLHKIYGAEPTRRGVVQPGKVRWL